MGVQQSVSFLTLLLEYREPINKKEKKRVHLLNYQNLIFPYL